jgi:hypothetical protein
MTAEDKSLLALLRDSLDIHGRIERNPYGMVAGALGVGYVLGGGLFTRLTERIAGVALRTGLMAVLPRIEQGLGWSDQRRGSDSKESDKGE